MKTMTELSPDQRRRQRQKNIALAVGLVLLVVLFYVVTVVKLGGNVS